MTNLHDVESSDEDYVEPKKRRKKPRTVTLTVSTKDLAKETAVTAKRHKVEIVAQRDMLANVINIGGGNVDDFSLSNKTVRRAGTSAV